jgi:hypothetical protein
MDREALQRSVVDTKNDSLRGVGVLRWGPRSLEMYKEGVGSFF